jgi:hypothetical protein
LVSRSRIRNRNWPAWSPRSSRRLRACRGDPRGGWLGGDAEHVDPAGGVLYDGEAVQPCQRDGVGVKEVFKPRLAPITYGGARRTARGSTICNNDLGSRTSGRL